MTTAQELKSLKKELTDVKNILADQIEDHSSNGHTMITREEIQQMANNAGQSVRSFFKTKGEQFDHAKTRTTRTIKARPLTSAAVAIAGGMVLGALLRRK